MTKEEQKIIEELNILRYKPEPLTQDYSDEEALEHILKVIKITKGVSPLELQELCFIVWGQDKKKTRTIMQDKISSGEIIVDWKLKLVLGD